MIIIAVKDVFFSAKISETANRLGKKTEFATDENELLSMAKKGNGLVIADLNAFPLSSLEAAKKEGLTIIGYLSHVQTDLRKRAVKVCDEVITQSELTKDLPNIISKH